MVILMNHLEAIEKYLYDVKIPLTVDEIAKGMRLDGPVVLKALNNRDRDKIEMVVGEKQGISGPMYVHKKYKVT